SSDFGPQISRRMWRCVRMRPGCLTNNRSRAYSVAVSLISRPFLILTSDFLARWDAVAKNRKGGFSSEKFQLASDVRNDKRTEILRRPGGSSRAANISDPRPKGHARYRPGRTLPRSHQIPESCR